jgi:hypothetical protein
MTLTLSLLPATGLQTTIRVDEQKVGGEDLEHGGDAVLDLLLGGDTGRVNVIHTGSDLVRVTVVLEGIKQLHVALRRLNRDDIRVKVLNRRKDVVEVGVAEVRVGLKGIGDTGGRELEGGESPSKVGLPIDLAKRKLLNTDEYTQRQMVEQVMLTPSRRAGSST